MHEVQKWKGTVTSIEEDEFTARLKDLTSRGTDETANFKIDKFTKEKDSIKVGATFYWIIKSEVIFL